ncbi:hypothetical protein ScPMuIL_014250 [Solemya velum]
MWKRWRDFTSNINFNFLTNWFQKRSYSRFGSEEDIYLRDGESYYEVPSMDSHYIYNGRDDETDEADVGIRRQRRTLCEVDKINANTIHYSDMNGGIGGDKPELTPREVSYLSASPANVKNDVQEFMDSKIQKRYSKLDNADDASEITYAYDDEMEEADDQGVVFHSIKDCPQWQQKKKSRRKKITKGTRKAVRTSWKWLRRGFTAYAMSFNFRWPLGEVAANVAKM